MTDTPAPPPPPPPKAFDAPVAPREPDVPPENAAPPPALTPEDRAKARGRTRTVLSREYAKVKPGSAAFEVLKRAGAGVYNDGFIHAGNLAYLALMTLFPFVIVTAAVLSVIGQSAETQRAIGSFLSAMPGDVRELLRKPITDVLAARTGAPLLLGGLVGLWTVGSFVETIREIFRRAYGTKSHQALWRARLGLTFAILCSVVLVLLSFLVQGALTAAEQFIYRLIPWAEDVAGWLGIARLIPAAIMFGALYALFYFVTPSKYRYTEARKWPGALFVTIWWVSMTAGLPFALSLLGGYDLTYGSLAGVVVMLLFFYLIGLGFVAGAHLNAALAEPPPTGLGGDATATEQKAVAA